MRSQLQSQNSDIICGVETGKPQQESIVTQSIETGSAIKDDGKKSWNHLVDQILSRDGKIIALRGAGSINGADVNEAKILLENELIPRIEKAISENGHVTILFDGDSDSPEKPDIGYFAGRLLDKFGNNKNGVTFIAVQKRSWYFPRKEGGNLSNASGSQFVTYVFEDGAYPGDHNTFTQDERLVQSDKYEQWYIGASGDIATSQLQDYDSKVPEGQKRVAVLFRVKNNPVLDSEIQGKLEVARTAGDEVKIKKFEGQLVQRQKIYGSHWDNSGKPNITDSQFSKIGLSFVTPN